jgi:hypothetical protein
LSCAPVLVTASVKELPHVMSTMVPKPHRTGANAVGLPKRPANALEPVLHILLSAACA